jgi:murein DD-endopeptidase MepM/ murein hydrolase activator NlpD
MPAEETPQEGIRTHRPLPSVDIPLLRDDRRASRKRQWVTTAAVVATLGGSAVAAFWLPRWFGGGPEVADSRAGTPAVPLALGTRPDAADAGLGVEEPALPAPGLPPSAAAPTPIALTAPPERDAGPPPMDDVTPTSPDATTRRTVAFGRAGGFQPALTGAGASREEAEQLTAALTGVLDFRRCRPEDQLTFERSGDGRLVRFEYHADRTHIYEAVRRGPGGTLVGRQVEVPIQRVRVAKGGYVSGSLGDALDHNGLGRSLVGVFVDTLASRVNFGTQTREGDAFRIVVDEERVQGEFLRYGTVHALEYTGARSGTHRAFHFTPREGAPDYFDETGRSMHGGWLRTPVAYDRISSVFDPRRMHPVLRRIKPHNGIDYAASTGTPVWAAADGTVIWAGERGPNGNLVGLRHADGFDSYYAHLSRIERGIRVGATVRQRQVIGAVGTTGRSTGPHLHFGLQRRGRFVDPARYLNGPGRMMAPASLPAFRRVARDLGAELTRVPLAPAPAGRGAPPPPDAFDGDEEEIDVPAVRRR